MSLVLVRAEPSGAHFPADTEPWPAALVAPNSVEASLIGVCQDRFNKQTNLIYALSP